MHLAMHSVILGALLSRKALASSTPGRFIPAHPSSTFSGVLLGPKMTHNCCVRRAILGTAVLALSPALSAYSVLTHEAIIDSAWDRNIKPLLTARFPAATAHDLIEAHAYAYGGCILQDMGYYPFGSKFFSDLVHYVRSGDFVANLIRESQGLDEYAFALGALAHYAADNEGHSIAVNLSVPVEFPKLKKKYGRVVTYADNPAAHIKVEFGFDVAQVARGAYAPQAYHDFIGFQVSEPVLERAFHDTYSLHLTDVSSDLDLALGTYRRTVSKLIPDMTKVAWSMKKVELRNAQPKLQRRAFVYNLSRASYHREWSNNYERPGIGARIFAFLLRLLPKVGPLKALAFKIPTPQTERLFETSFDRTMDTYRSLLREQDRSHLTLANMDFDTGKPTQPCEYKLADDTYALLAIQLADRDSGTVDAATRAAVLGFFQNLDLPYATKRDPEQWRRTVAAVEKLRSHGDKIGAGTPNPI